MANAGPRIDRWLTISGWCWLCYLAIVAAALWLAA
jgi:hypothetical protein